MRQQSLSARLCSARGTWRLATLMVLVVGMVLALAAPAFAAGTITGKVVDDYDQPVVGHEVNLYLGDMLDTTVVTDGFGRYTFVGVPDGECVVASANGYTGAADTATLYVEGDVVRQDFYWGGKAFVGSVSEYGTNLPLPGVRVEAWTYDWETENAEFIHAVMTDETGEFVFQAINAPVGQEVFFKYLPGDPYRSGLYGHADEDEWWRAWPEVYDGEFFVTGIDILVDANTPAISGTVYDSEFGEPLSWIAVTAWAWDDSTGEYMELGWEETDVVGQYALYASDLYGFPGPYFVTFEDWNGYNLAAQTYEGAAYKDWDNATPVEVGATNVDAWLDPAPPVAVGRVVEDGTGDPVWAMVGAYQFYAEEEPLAQTGEWYTVGWGDTDEDGYYALQGYPELNSPVVVGVEHAEGHVPEFFENVDFGDFTAATKLPYTGETLEGVDFSLAPSVPAVAGVVTDEVTGEPLAGVEVKFWTATEYGLDWMTSVETDADGVYQFDTSTVRKGSFWVEFDATNRSWDRDASYYREFYNNKPTFEQADELTYAGTFIDGIDAALAPSTVGISGVVTGSDTSAGLEGVGVDAARFNPEWDEWETTAWDITDETGSYSLPDSALPHGAYAVMFYGDEIDYFSRTYDNVDGIDPAAGTPLTYDGTEISGIDAVLDPAPEAITGTVTDEATGAPIKGLTVETYVRVEEMEGEVWWEPSGYAVTDETGQYRLTEVDIQPGQDYALIFQGWELGYRTETYDDIPGYAWDAENVTLVSYTGEPISGIDAALQVLPKVVQGTVTDVQTGLPLEGASAYLWRYDEEWEDWWPVDGVSTYADGTYALKDDAGTAPYKVSVERPDYQSKMTGEFSYAGSTLTRNIALKPVGFVDRVAGASRFSGSVVMARSQFDPDSNGTWPGVTDIVIASGEDRAAADPLAAAGLCGAYNAPLFLVSSAAVPSEVKNAVVEIAKSADGPVTVHIVGGSASVPDARFNDLKVAVGANGTLAKDRILGTGGRFDLSAAIARRLMQVNDGVPPVVLVANGMDAPKFFDALALSPIAARNGFPLLLVSRDGVPAATAKVLGEMYAAGGEPMIVVGGGPNTVSNGVLDDLGAERWAGDTRYTTAIAIADNAVANDFLTRESVGIAAKLPDALTGGAMVGLKGGVLVLTDGATVSPATRSWLTAHRSEIVSCEVFGGTKSVTPSVHTAISAALAQ